MIPPVPLRRVCPPNPDPAESILEQLTLGSDGFIPLPGDPCSEYPPSNGVKPLLLSKTVTMMAERTHRVNHFAASDVDFFTPSAIHLSLARILRWIVARVCPTARPALFEESPNFCGGL
jgi:hypothetical protein